MGKAAYTSSYTLSNELYPTHNVRIKVNECTPIIFVFLLLLIKLCKVYSVDKRVASGQVVFLLKFHF